MKLTSPQLIALSLKNKVHTKQCDNCQAKMLMIQPHLNYCNKCVEFKIPGTPEKNKEITIIE